ncbi:MAG TPA: hypothetical protein VKB47_05635 [Terracidiphilus sp.]|nr:hypothetical protein [Terracidiphilus sp.]
MIRPPLAFPPQSIQSRALSAICRHRAVTAAGVCAFALCVGTPVSAQVITIDTHGNATSSNGNVDRRYAQIKPTEVQLSNTELDAKTRSELIRVLESEQGFAMRPFPRGHKGLTLEANGKLSPAGEGWLDMITADGVCAKPGDPVQLTDVKIEKDKIVFMLNGGPDAKHRFLRHVQIGAGGGMNPVVQGDDQEPTGARLTLTFKGRVPELTGSQVKALLAPLISFDVKTPIQAFTDTLPPKLKEAILNHNVWVGMSTDMVLFAKGQPERKIREVHDQQPFEEWIYGQPPQPVEFVRINGNRVIRVEIAKVGEAPEVFTKDEVDGLMRTDGTPIIEAAPPHIHTAKVGDIQRDPETQSPDAPPSLVGPGEKLPENAQQNQPGGMKPVQFPKQKPDDYPDATNLPRDHKSSDDGTEQQAKPNTEQQTNPDPLDQVKPSSPGAPASTTSKPTQTDAPAAPAQKPSLQPPPGSSPN